MNHHGFAVALCLILFNVGFSCDPDAVIKSSDLASIKLVDIWSNRRPLQEFFPEGKKAMVLVFSKKDCPGTKLHAPQVMALEKIYREKDVAFAYLFPNSGDSLNDIGMFGLDYEVPFPILKDHHNELAESLKVTRTPEVVILRPDYSIVYRGLIDDSVWAGGRRPAREKYLVEALDQFLAGEKVGTPKTDPLGCLLERYTPPEKDTSLTYAKNVAPIIHNKCAGCHRPNGVAPFALTNWEEVKRHLAMTEEVVELERMPPWQATMDENRFGKFFNDKRLSAEEKRTLLSWLASGRKPGDLKSAPAYVSPETEWNIGKPDAIVEMSKPFRVPATGEIDYQWIGEDSKFKEGMWIRAAEVRPGVPQVVHHINVHITDGAPTSSRRVINLIQLFGIDGARAAFVGSFIPGEATRHYPPGYGVYVPADSTLVFEQHYTPNGSAVDDRSRVGVLFAKEAPKYRIRSHLLVQRKIFLDADEGLIKSAKSATFDKPFRLISVKPHMHKRGKHFSYDLTYPDGKKERLLSVPRWDFNWQSIYEFEKPIELPAETTITITAYWDNSALNPNNPASPPQDVRWGLRSSSEMMNGGLTYAYDSEYEEQ